MASFENFPENSRIWIFQSARQFTAPEMEWIKSKNSIFILSWSSHREKLKAAIEIFYDRFLVVAADENFLIPSGCSIDSLNQFLRSIEKEFNLSLFGRMDIAFKDGNSVSTFHYNQLEKLLIEGKINENTIVFNNLVSSKKEFLHQWEVPLKQTWLNKISNPGYAK